MNSPRSRAGSCCSYFLTIRNLQFKNSTVWQIQIPTRRVVFTYFHDGTRVSLCGVLLHLRYWFSSMFLAYEGTLLYLIKRHNPADRSAWVNEGIPPCTLNLSTIWASRLDCFTPEETAQNTPWVGPRDNVKLPLCTL
jgi:hypothetical protein